MAAGPGASTTRMGAATGLEISSTLRGREASLRAMQMPRLLVTALAWLPLMVMAQAGPDYAAMLEERARSLVVVTFYIEREAGQQGVQATGLVVDDEGLILLPDSAVPSTMPPAWFREMTIYLPGEGVPGYAAEYLGIESVNGWHYVRAPEAVRGELRPFDAHGTAAVKPGDFVWGVGLQRADLDFKPYFLSSRLAMTQKLPLLSGFAQEAIGTPGGPVYDAQGRFVGWAVNSYAEEFLLTLANGQQQRVGLQRIRETTALILAEDFVPQLGRAPGGPQAYVGVNSLRTLGVEAMEELGFEGQSGVVIQDLLPDSPGALAGLQEGDVIVAVDGRPLPVMKPANILPVYVQRLILTKGPGGTATFTVIRGEGTEEIPVAVSVAPKSLREAERKYFAQMGLELREFLMVDSARLEVFGDDARGAVVSFVLRDSPAAEASLQGVDAAGDWIVQVENQAVGTLDEAVELVQAAIDDPLRDEVTFTVRRGELAEAVTVRLR